MSADNVGNGSGGGVTFTVKELLGNLDRKLDGVLLKIDSKVDRTHFDLLVHRVETLETRITDAETARKTAEEVAITLKKKTEDERTWWEQWRAKIGFAFGLAIGVAQIHISFPHFL